MGSLRASWRRSRVSADLVVQRVRQVPPTPISSETAAFIEKLYRSDTNGVLAPLRAFRTMRPLILAGVVHAVPHRDPITRKGMSLCHLTDFGRHAVEDVVLSGSRSIRV